jgi:hypothetical protein
LQIFLVLSKAKIVFIDLLVVVEILRSPRLTRKGHGRGLHPGIRVDSGLLKQTLSFSFGLLRLNPADPKCEERKTE